MSNRRVLTMIAAIGLLVWVLGGAALAQTATTTTTTTTTLPPTTTTVTSTSTTTTSTTTSTSTTTTSTSTTTSTTTTLPSTTTTTSPASNPPIPGALEYFEVYGSFSVGHESYVSLNALVNGDGAGYLSVFRYDPYFSCQSYGPDTPLPDIDIRGKDTVSISATLHPDDFDYCGGTPPPDISFDLEFVAGVVIHDTGQSTARVIKGDPGWDDYTYKSDRWIGQDVEISGWFAGEEIAESFGGYFESAKVQLETDVGG